MSEWRVHIEYRMRGYVIVNAESAEAARTLVEVGDYDIFGEDRYGRIEIVFTERVPHVEALTKREGAE